MNKTQLVDAVAEAAELPKAVAGRAIETMLNCIKAALAEEDEVALLGFGTFKVKVRAARSGRNPKTGDVLQIPASKVASFTAGKGLKEAVNEGLVAAEEA